MFPSPYLQSINQSKFLLLALVYCFCHTLLHQRKSVTVQYLYVCCIFHTLPPSQEFHCINDILTFIFQLLFFCNVSCPRHPSIEKYQGGLNLISRHCYIFPFPVRAKKRLFTHGVSSYYRLSQNPFNIHVSNIWLLLPPLHLIYWYQATSFNVDTFNRCISVFSFQIFYLLSTLFQNHNEVCLSCYHC